MGREASDAGTDRFRRGSGDGTHGRGLPTILQVSFCVVVTAVEMGVR